MRVYLSSYRLGAQAEVLRADGGRAAVVMNALDVFPERLRAWQRETDDLALLGYTCTELDLREYWDEPARLTGRLAGVDLLWVVGGNAFVLARAATAAGLGDALRANPHVTYAGYSAGACLASVDLAGIELMDDPRHVPAGYRLGISADTLGLSGTRIVPHAGTPDADAAEARLAAAGLAYTALADGEDLIVRV